MATVNIRRDVKDAFYRYKMPKLLSKIEGKGNGIKTVIPNMVEISKALNRPPAYVTKFFGSELGAQVICDEKNARYIVNGAHEAEKLSSILDSFIQKFVLCPGCDNPETNLVITKDEQIIRVCKACGQRNSVDMLHKVTAYILKNPVSSKKDYSKNEKDDEIQEKKEKADSENLLSSLSLVDNEIEEDDEDPFEEFASYLNQEKNANPDEIYTKAKEFGLKPYKAVVVLIQVLFTEEIVNEIPKKVALLKKFTEDDERSQRAVLGALERFIGLTFPSLEKKITPIFLALFNNDIIEEESFMKWFEKVSKRYVDKETAKKIRKLAEPFITWLKEAEEEDDDE